MEVKKEGASHVDRGIIIFVSPGRSREREGLEILVMLIKVI